MMLRLLLVYATVSAAGLALLKLGMTRDGAPRPWTESMAQPIFWLGFIAYGGGFLIWLWLLRRYPLAIVFPIAAGAVFAMSCAIDHLVLGSPVSLRTILGGLVILGGIVIAGWGR